MKYTIEHSCGHDEEIQLFGKTAERERRIAWLESKPCRECESRERAARAKEAGLPDLEGSEKQIAWAVDIRQRMLAEFEEYTAGLIRSSESRGKITEEQAALARKNTGRALEAIKAVSSAKWFIDHRDEAMMPLYRTACGLAVENEE